MVARMSSGHLVGYVGGLAVALGVGTAAWLGTPTASADASAPSSHSASARTGHSARATQRTNTVAAKKPAPKAAKAAAAAPHHLSLAYDPDTDATSVTVVDTATNTPIGSTVTVDGSADAPVLSSDGKRALITTTDHNPVTDHNDTVAVVIDMTAGKQIGNTFGFAGASPMSTSFAPDGNRAVLTLFLTSTTRIWVATLDTAAGTQTGTVTLEGYPFVAPVWNADGSRVLITLSQGGETTAVTVLDATTGDTAGTALIPGFTRRTPLVTADGTRSVMVTDVHTNAGGHTRVTVINTDDGSPVGKSLRILGTAKISSLGDGHTILVSNGSGFVSILDTRTAAASPPLPLLPPWGLDAATLIRTPLGAALAPVVFFVGFFGSAIFAFNVLPAILAIPAWIGEIVRQFPPIR